MRTLLETKKIEEIRYEDKLFGILLRADFKDEGITFFTPPEFSQQMGYMNRRKGYKVNAHMHKKVERNVSFTQEVLIVRSGKIKVTFYNSLGKYVFDCVLHKGDTILLAEGGHSVEMLEDSELIEIKQGPYEVNDKVFLNANNSDED